MTLVWFILFYMHVLDWVAKILIYLTNSSILRHYSFFHLHTRTIGWGLYFEKWKRKRRLPPSPALFTAEPFRLLLSLTGWWTERPNDPVNGATSPAQHGLLPAIVSAAFIFLFYFLQSSLFIGWKLLFFFFSLLWKQTTMDRVKSSMQQVPNAIPKVIRRTGGANSLELEKENFERGQVWSRMS